MLITDHIEHLRKSALSDTTIIDLMSCRSVVGAECATISPVLAQCDSVLVFPYPGTNGFPRYKPFPPIETTSGIMRYYQPPGSGNHLYVLPPVTAKLHDTSVPLFLVEGEKKAASLVERGYAAVGIAGLWNWKETDSWDGIPELKEIPFVDREVVIVPDNDIWTQKRTDLQKAVYSLGKYLETCGAKVSVIVLPPSINKIGADDYFAAGHSTDDFDHLHRLRLNDLPLAQHKRWYAEWKELREAQPKGEGKTLPAFMTDTNPGTEAVNGTDLLNAIVKLICLYVVVSTELVHSVALWILHAWALDAFDISPLLFITSATKRCGKSLLLEIVGALSPRPLVASNITGPTLFRVVEQYHPTVLVDEADTFIRENDELRGIINAGHRRSTAYVARTFGDNHEVKLFSTWAPKAIAAIDKIADTLEDRSVIIHIKRRAPNEKIQRFRSAECIALADPLRARAARWAQDNIETLRRSKPDVPEALNDRAANNWEALFAIADLAGDEWRQWARTAALTVSGETEESDDSVLVDLLKEFREIFNSLDRISSADLVKRLSDNPEGRWIEYGQARKPITQRQVARILSPIKIRPNSVKLHGGGTVKGYLQEWFIDAFSRYTPENGDPIRNQRNQRENKEESPDTDPEPDGPSSGSKTPKNNNEINEVPEVPDRNGVSSGGNIFSEDQCPDCHVRMGRQLRLDGGLDFLCPRCGSTRVATSISEQSSTLPTVLDRFGQIVFFDFEGHCPDGGNPQPHCAVFREHRSGKIVRLMREEFSATPPFGTGPGSLWVAFAGTFDLRCLLALGLPLPENYLDLCIETKRHFNTPGPDRGLPGLVEALGRFGIEHRHVDKAEKKKQQKRFGKPTLTDDDRHDILDYCQQDVDPLPALFSKLSEDDLDKALERGAYARETAVIEQRGVPIAVADYQKIAANRAQIRRDLIKHSPVGSTIYTEKGSFSYKKFAAWLDLNEITGWESTPSGRLCTTEEYLAKVATIAPAVQPFLDLYLALKDFKKIPFAIGPDGRSHADQQPFATITGRNAASKFVLLAAKFWRWAAQSPRGFAFVNADFSNEEYAVAGALSGDPAMIEGYRLPDVYQSVADELGVARKVAKVACLAIQYGAHPKRLEAAGIPYHDAKKIFEYHKDTYSIYWRWSDAVLDQLKSTGYYTVDGDGWVLHLDDSTESGNALLSARNFPIQATAAAIQRRVVLDVAKEGIEVVGPLHDSILAQVPAKDAGIHAERLCEIMRAVSRQFLNGHEVRVAFHIYKDRFEDEDGRDDWNRVAKLLTAY